MTYYRIFSLGAAAVALSMMSASLFAAPGAEEPTHDGQVVSVTSDKLVMTTKGGQDGKEHSHTLAATAKVTLDGKTCKLADLKPGTKIRVTTQADDETVATHIEAINRLETFANTHDGQLISMTGAELVMTGKDGKEHSHSVSPETKVTCDGKVCKMGDLKAGMKIRVTTKKADKGTLIEIEALSKNAKFA
ncbi:MAG: hypothetical protein AB7U20_24775 [Planctomycetaceae bacterium]